MKQQRNSQNLHCQLKRALKKSELVQQPATTIFIRYFEQFVFWAINLITVLLLCPFSWRSVILEGFVLLFALLLSRKWITPKRLGVLSLRWWAVTSIMFLFAAVCPFIIAAKPAYFAATESNNPFLSEVCPLESGGKSIGSVMVVSDVDLIRKKIASVLNKAFPANFRILERTDYESGSYYRLPIFKGFTTDPTEPSQRAWKKCVYFPWNQLRHTMHVSLVHPHPLSTGSEDEQNNIGFGFDVTTFGLVDFTYTQYPDTIPWDCVRMQKGQETAILSYAATLDRVLEHFAAGNGAEAVLGLESAAPKLPKSNLEGARLAVLHYGAMRFYLGGNIGELQSLPYLHRAYEVLLRSQADPRFSERDPLVNWLRAVLLAGYDKLAWSTCFFDRTSKLKEVPHLEEEQIGHTEELQSGFKRMSYDELLKSVQSNDRSAVELHIVRSLVFERFTHKWPIALNRMAAHGFNIEIAGDCAVEAKRAIPIVEQVDSMLAQRYGLKMDKSLINFLEFVAYDLPKMASAQNEKNADGQIEGLLKSNPLLSDWQILFSMSDNKTSIQMLQKGKEKEWWTMEYLNWFYGWGGNAISEAYSQKYPFHEHDPSPFGGPDTSELISKNGLDCFIRDMDGKGRTFLPGVFCMAWYAQEFNLPEAESLKAQFEQQTLIPFETYLSSLYRQKE